MNKIVYAIALSLMLILTGVNDVFAEDVYVCSSKTADIYLDNDSVRGWPEEFTCRIGVIDKNGRSEHATCGFVTMNGMVMGAVQGHQNVIVTPSGSPTYWAIYKKALQYLEPLH